VKIKKREERKRYQEAVFNAFVHLRFCANTQEKEIKQEKNEICFEN